MSSRPPPRCGSTSSPDALTSPRRSPPAPSTPRAPAPTSPTSFRSSPQPSSKDRDERPDHPDDLVHRRPTRALADDIREHRPCHRRPPRRRLPGRCGRGRPGGQGGGEGTAGVEALEPRAPLPSPRHHRRGDPHPPRRTRAHRIRGHGQTAHPGLRRRRCVRPLLRVLRAHHRGVLRHDDPAGRGHARLHAPRTLRGDRAHRRVELPAPAHRPGRGHFAGHWQLRGRQTRR